MRKKKQTKNTSPLPPLAIHHPHKKTFPWTNKCFCGWMNMCTAKHWHHISRTLTQIKILVSCLKKKKRSTYLHNKILLHSFWHSEHLYQTMTLHKDRVLWGFYIQLSMIKKTVIIQEDAFHWRNTHLLRISLLLFCNTMFAGTYDILNPKYMRIFKVCA